MTQERYQNPDVQDQQLGPLNLRIHSSVPTGLERTTHAMVKLCQAEYRDDLAKKQGKDEYSQSIDKLCDGLDAFIRERFKDKSAGKDECYDLSRPEDCTLFLIWQYRHVVNHRGGQIDEKCKSSYDFVYSRMETSGIEPVIYLPPRLDIDKIMTFNFEDYKNVRQCFFKYVGRHVSSKDLAVLKARASIVDHRIEGAHIIMPIGDLLISININKAISIGASFNPLNGGLDFPDHCRYIPDLSSIVNFQTGEMLNVEVVTQEDLKSTQEKPDGKNVIKAKLFAVRERPGVYKIQK